MTQPDLNRYRHHRRTARRRHWPVAIMVVALIAVAGPSGRLAIEAHDPADPSPHRVEATIALGKAALSILITWTTDHLRN